MKLTRKNMQILPSASEIGTYLWRLPNGKWLADEDSNMLSCTGLQGDIRIMSEMAAAARECGYPDGQAVWHPGTYKVSDEEFAEQMAELKDGRDPSVIISRSRR